MLPSVIWLDVSADIQGKFRDALTQYKSIVTFADPADCLSYIKAHENDQIYLIISGSFARDMVPEVAHYSHIALILVFCASIKSHLEWAIDYSDKMMMFDFGDDLLQRLWLELEQSLRTEAQQLLVEANELHNRAQLLKPPSCG